MATPLSDSTIAILGAGNLGHALLKGIVESRIVAPERIYVRNKRPEKTKKLASTYGIHAADSNVEAVRRASIVLLAVKPQILPQVLGEISGATGHDPLFISVAAGVTTERIQALLGGTPRVVRAMPNTPAVVHESATAIASGAHADAEDLEIATKIFEQVGKVVTVDEAHMDAVTGLSGSGPAYVMMIVEAFCDAGVKVGLSREIAMELAVQTLLGSVRMLMLTGEHPGRLKDQVTSPGGTAIAGLHTLEAGGLRTTIMNAVERATLRAAELGKSSS